MAVFETSDSHLFLQVAEHSFVIVKYDTDECGKPCMEFRPIYLELSGDPLYKNVLFLTMNAENNPEAKKHILNKRQPVITIYTKGRLRDSGHCSTKLGVQTMLEKLLNS